jgi:uncharacterized membrane protein
MNYTRFLSIDIVRATAILLMIQVHFMQNLAAYTGPWIWLYDVSVVLGSFAAPMFTFLVGLSLYLWEHKRKYEKWSESDIKKYWLRRGFFIFIFGLLFIFAIWTPNQLFVWDILTLIGASTLLIFLLRKAPIWGKVGIAFAILLASPPLREATNYSMHWSREFFSVLNAGGIFYHYNLTFKDIFLGFFLQGYFPLLPWFVFPLLGYATGEWFFNERNRCKVEGWGLGIIGVILIALSGIGTLGSHHIPEDLTWYVSHLSFYPATTTFVIGMLGFTLVFIWILYRLFDMRNKAPRGPVYDFFSRYSRYSLSTYTIHLAVIMWSVYIAGWLIMDDMWYYYENSFSPPMALALALLFIVAFYFVLILWDRKHGKYSFEWMLRKLSG